MKKKHLIICASLLFIVLIALGILLRNHLSDPPPQLEIDSAAIDWEGRQFLQKSFNGAGGIAIPGFDLLYFSANQSTQKVNFYNPSSNDCLFKMSLIVGDTVLWESENVAPGKGFYEIELRDPLPQGDYIANLKIACQTTDGQPLNGAIVEFKLIVQ